MTGDNTYTGLSDAELASYPTVFRDDLLRDQVVLISGAAGAIGRATAVLAGRLGATVVGCGRNAESLAELERLLTGLDIPCSMHPMTIRDPEQVAALLDAVWARHGRLDVLVNNAGGQFAAPALDISPKGWHAVVETILYGTWYMMQEAARRWIGKGRPGCVVNMAALTNHAQVGIPHTAAARAGEINLSKTLAVEWAPQRIRINCIAIGVIAGPGLVNYPPSAKPSFDHNPMRRMGDVMDIAEATVYLAAPSGKFITGSVLTVDGGEDVWGEYWALGKPDHFKIDE
jgi:NAD(P)-dependent dehydrogenase (short-subunit alcohol dehydrogenase family)